MLEQPVRARLDRNGLQVAEVTVHAGYHPDAIIARAGLPLRLVFRREDDDVCSERVIFSRPHVDRRLASTGTTTIDLPAQPPGDIRFTCGMGRYRGHIGFVEAQAPSIVARFRDTAAHHGTPIGTALVLWICSLPLIALLAILTLDPTAALAAEGAVLVALAAASLRAKRGSTHTT